MIFLLFQSHRSGTHKEKTGENWNGV